MTNKNNLRLPLYLYIGLGLFLFAITGCGPSPEEKAKEQKEAVPVRVMRVELKDIQNTLDYVGDIKAEDEAVVYPKVGGKIIEKLKNEGDSVAKGDVIAYIDRDEVGFKFEKAPVESPMSGIIGRVYVDIGTQVSPQTQVALAVHMDNVKIDLDIPEQYLPKISVGQTAQIFVQAYPGKEFIGKVSRISPVLDLETRTAPIEIIISNSDHALKSGMFAQVKLVIEERKDVPVIVKEAIMGKEPGLYVYAVNGNAAHQRNIKLGIRQAAYYEVSEGLKEGDLVVVMGQQQLYDGAPVSIEEGKTTEKIESQGDK
ncbi:MAG: efflux RND transporter periplasmic adaptor subunit [Candidatus Omnitrophica bacterium]|nr:efflux RND transporter periplasmic adaptor subunit [Candidatus Omnitrophota bacterium]MDD5566282.1 efflux RND transporter periplasmic adaptor subunit [Candidatus Omnitrophota bacterium]